MAIDAGQSYPLRRLYRGPAVVGVGRVHPPALHSMVASGVLASFPYRCSAPAYGATGFSDRLQTASDQLPGTDRALGWSADAVPGPGHPVVVRWAGGPAPRAYPGALSRVPAARHRGNHDAAA